MTDTPSRKADACRLAADGLMQIEIARAIGVDQRTIWDWKVRDPVFAASFTRAQENGSLIVAEKMVETATTEPNPKRAAVINDAVKWRLERQFRRQWSPSMDLNVNQTVDLQGALIEARKRSLLPGSNLAALPAVQDAEYTMLPSISTTDSESVAVRTDSPPDVDPFS